MKRNYEEIALLSKFSYDNSPMKGAVSTHVSFNIEARFNRGLEANVIAGGPWTSILPKCKARRMQSIPLNGAYISTARTIDIPVL
jgi:hypothetical protein